MIKESPIQLYNTMTRSKEDFVPIDDKNVRVYACGPTVYDRIHVGNARPLVVFDVLVRLLRYHYGDGAVKYVRNITDVDDRINERAAERGIPIEELTEETTKTFHADCAALNVLAPDVEPRATGYIPEMVEMIKVLIEKGHAYEAEGHVLFDVTSRDDYGVLSRRGKKELQAGARVEVAPYKKNSGDFVLWKPSAEGLPGWESPWGRGRPGWHIECSAMSAKHLGEVFDIHAGGLDLIFPHHENEIAQSCCAHGTEAMANYWVHNGYVTMSGEKMAKSEGNVITVADAVEKYGGEAVRFALLLTHYRSPLDFTDELVEAAKKMLGKLYHGCSQFGIHGTDKNDLPDEEFMEALDDDLNIPKAVARLYSLFNRAGKEGHGKGDDDMKSFYISARLLGIFESGYDEYMQGWYNEQVKWAEEAELEKQADEAAEAEAEFREIIKKIEAREYARKNDDYETADRIREELVERGIVIEDTTEGIKWGFKKYSQRWILKNRK